MTGLDIIEEARKHLKTPFLHQGRLTGRALDCAGLIVVVAKNLNIDIVDTSGYGRSPNGALSSVIAAQTCITQVSIADKSVGDVLIMRFDGEEQHLAFYTGENIIHSYKAVGCVCEHVLDDLWRSRIVKVYRFKGLV